MKTTFMFLSARKGKIAFLRDEKKKDACEILTICKFKNKYAMTIKRPDEPHCWETAKVNAFVRLASGALEAENTKGLFVVPETTVLIASAERAGFPSTKKFLSTLGAFLNDNE